MATDTNTAASAVTEPPKGDLAKRTDIITTPTEYESALKKWEGRFNLLTPFTQITGLAHQHGIIASTVKINNDPAKGGPGEVYDGLPFLGRDEVALAKIGLRKIAEAAGISITTQRTDPRTLMFYWEFKAIATYRGIDGTVVTREATAEWDLRDGSPRLKGWKPAQVEEGRKNGLRNAETRAINAAIREFGLKQKYTRQELEKPFLVIRVSWQPNPNDPEQMRIVAEHAMRGTSTLYGAPALPAAAAPLTDIVDADVVTTEPRTVGAGTADVAKPAKVETPDPNAPPVEGAVRIADVKEKKGVNEKTQRPWLRFDVIDSNGEVCSTFDTKLAEAARAAQASQAWVELSIEQNGNYRNLVELSPAGQQPKLPNPEDL